MGASSLLRAFNSLNSSTSGNTQTLGGNGFRSTTITRSGPRYSGGSAGATGGKTSDINTILGQLLQGGAVQQFLRSGRENINRTYDDVGNEAMGDLQQRGFSGSNLNTLSRLDTADRRNSSIGEFESAFLESLLGTAGQQAGLNQDSRQFGAKLRHDLQRSNADRITQASLAASQRNGVRQHGNTSPLEQLAFAGQKKRYTGTTLPNFYGGGLGGERGFTF